MKLPRHLTWLAESADRARLYAGRGGQPVIRFTLREPREPDRIQRVELTIDEAAELRRQLAHALRKARRVSA